MTPFKFDGSSWASGVRARPVNQGTGLLLTTSAILLAGCGGGEGAGDNLDKQVSCRSRRRSP